MSPICEEVGAAKTSYNHCHKLPLGTTQTAVTLSNRPAVVQHIPLEARARVDGTVLADYLGQASEGSSTVLNQIRILASHDVA